MQYGHARQVQEQNRWQFCLIQLHVIAIDKLQRTFRHCICAKVLFRILAFLLRKLSIYLIQGIQRFVRGLMWTKTSRIAGIADGDGISNSTSGIV